MRCGKGFANWDTSRDRDVILETRFAEDALNAFRSSCADTLRALNIDVLVVGSTLGAAAAKRATTTVPIVFAGLYDPVATGIVASLARAGRQHRGPSWGLAVRASPASGSN